MFHLTVLCYPCQFLSLLLATNLAFHHHFIMRFLTISVLQGLYWYFIGIYYYIMITIVSEIYLKSDSRIPLCSMNYRSFPATAFVSLVSQEWRLYSDYWCRLVGQCFIFSDITIIRQVMHRMNGTEGGNRGCLMLQGLGDIIGFHNRPLAY